MKKITLKFLLLVLSLSTTHFLNAQDRSDRTRCYSSELMEAQIKANSNIGRQIERRDAIIRDYLQNESTDFRSASAGANYVIPLVVYVVHDNGPENITDQQIHSQIDAVNAHFQSSGIEFCLATANDGTPLPGTGTDPGIIRIQNNLTYHNFADPALSALSNLPPERYMRIWVVNSMPDAPSVLGYATSPQAGLTPADGIVMRYDAFGDIATCGCSNLHPIYNEGKTLTHEIGHYLGLYHIFHGGCSGLSTATCDSEGDLVCDTPPAGASHFGCPASDDSCTETPNTLDLVNNYMDYVDDACMNAFTDGQCARMHAEVTNFRSTLVSNPNHIWTGIPCAGNVFAAFTVDTYVNCTGTTLNFDAANVPGATYTWDFGDGSPLVTGISQNHLFSVTGTYLVTLTVSDGTDAISSSEFILIEDCAPIQSTEGNWYFHESRGLNFASGIPVYDNSAEINNTMNVDPGGSCAVQSDELGNLLFYTDGVRIWDQNHTLVNVGNDLLGNTASQQGVLIVPDPGNANDYYVFTNDDFYSATTNPNGLRYSILQISTANDATLSSVFNQAVTSPPGYNTVNGSVDSYNGITAIASCNGYWIITMANRTDGSDGLLVFELTDTGLQFNSHFIVPGLARVNLEASPNGEHLAVGYMSLTNLGLWLYDFNKYSGIISNQQQLSQPGLDARKMSFSPNSQFLYSLNGDGFPGGIGGLYQYDVTASSPAGSEIQVVDKNEIRVLGLQRGPDNKIYANIRNSSRLGVIHFPDIACTTSNPNACFFSDNGPSIMANVDTEVLPNMIDANTQAVFAGTISYTTTNCTQYDFTADICTNTYNWDFGDPASGTNNTSTIQAPSHIFSAPGTYTVTLTAATGDVFEETIEIGIEAPAIAGSECNEVGAVNTYSVSPNSALDYNWTITGGSILGLTNTSSVNVEWASLPGTITLTITDPITECSASDNLTVSTNCITTLPCEVFPEFTYSQTSGSCDIQFTDLSTVANGTGFQWEWSFGDPTSGSQNTSNVQNPSHEYPEGGVYEVCLKAYGTNGVDDCEEKVCRVIEVTECDNSTACTEWPKTYGTSASKEFGIDSQTDKNGNVYVIGKTIEEGVQFMEEIPVGQNYDEDYFLAKYDAEGCLIWIEGLKGATQLEIDGSDNLLVVNDVRSGSGNGSIQKYSTNGEYIWGVDINGDNQIRVSVDNLTNAIAAVITRGINLTIQTPFQFHEIYPTSLNEVSTLAHFKSEGVLDWYAMSWKINLEDVVYTQDEVIYAVGFNNVGSQIVFDNADSTEAGTAGCLEGGGKCMATVQYKIDGSYQAAVSDILEHDKIQGRIEYWERGDIVYVSNQGEKIYWYTDNLINSFSNDVGNRVNLLTFNQEKEYLLAEDNSYEATFNLIKLKTNGNIIWTKDIFSEKYGNIAGAAFFDNAIYITGGYYDKTIFSNVDIGIDDIVIDQIGEDDLYVVRLKDEGGFSGFAFQENPNNVPDQLRSFEQLENPELTSSKINLYPNPADDQIIVSSEVPLIEYRIFSLNGKVLMKGNTTKSRQVTIDISELEKGIHFIQIHSEEGISTQKIIKM